jgi:acetylornithine deacetylase
MDKANLYATIGPKDTPGIMLSGHSDVVPVDGQDWTSNPFEMVQRGDNLYGRGACDMKGFIATALAYAPLFQAANLKTPIHLAFTYDEEITCAGAHTLIEALNSFPVKPYMSIVGEPTGMQVVTGQKSGYALGATVTGLEAHSSLAPQGVNAIEFASELIVFLRKMAMAVALRETITTYISRELEPQMKAIHPDAGFELEDLLFMPGFELDPGDDVIAFVRSLAARNDAIKVAYQTEAGLFAEDAGIPSVICGPGHISQAHKPDEYVSMDQLSQCCQFMTRLLDRTS